MSFIDTRKTPASRSKSWGMPFTKSPKSPKFPAPGDRFSNAQTKIFAGVGHLPYEECPQEFNRALVDYLGQEVGSAQTPPDVPVDGRRKAST